MPDTLEHDVAATPRSKRLTPPNQQGMKAATGGAFTVDIRIVLFTVFDGHFRLAIVERGGEDHLPRDWPTAGEPLDAGAARIIQQQLGIQERYLEQLYTLNTGNSGKWTVVVAYMALVALENHADLSIGVTWRDVNDPEIDRATDRRVIEYALVRLRAKLSYTTIAFHLLPARFTLGELQHVYEAILDRRLDKRNFRRRMIASGALVQTAGKRRDGSHRPAVLYEFLPPHDSEQFLTPAWVDGPPT